MYKRQVVCREIVVELLRRLLCLGQGVHHVAAAGDTGIIGLQIFGDVQRQPQGLGLPDDHAPVSYTHLDVYKRQQYNG